MNLIAVAAPSVAALVPLFIRATALRRDVRMCAAVLAAAAAFAAVPSLDPLARIFLAIVSILGAAATIFSADAFSGAFENGGAAWSRKPVYFVLLGLFWSAMLVVVLATTFSALWLGISATTLATAFLVGFGGEAAALEAAWKYLVLCSVGIAFALLGIQLLAHASMAAGIDPGSALAWNAIAAHPAAAGSPMIRVAIVLMLVGFATKAGLVPMHAWLPDAHSKAPAPVSGLLSGVLVSCALYALIRTLGVADALGTGGLARETLLVLGALSTITAGALMLIQRDLKRFLAYSTIEHAGIVALALGFGGPLGTFAALLHLGGHAFAKASAFFFAGVLQRRHGTTEIAALGGLWSDGIAGRSLLGALTALAGLPPFSLCVSELLVVFAGVAAHQWLALALGSAGMLCGFAALARTAIALESATALPRVPARGGTLRFALGAAGISLGGSLVLAVAPWIR